VDRTFDTNFTNYHEFLKGTSNSYQRFFGAIQRFIEISTCQPPHNAVFWFCGPENGGETGLFGNFKKVEEKPLTGYGVFPYSAFSVGGPVKTK